jgi:hypothetical protein
MSQPIVDTVQHEIAEEKADALARAGERLQHALERFRELEQRAASPEHLRGRRERLLWELAERVEALIVQREVCSANDPGAWELGWGMQMGPGFVLRANRIQRLTRLGSGRTRYDTSDTFSGLLVPVVMGLYRADIQRGFDGVARALKERAEKGAEA